MSMFDKLDEYIKDIDNNKNNFTKEYENIKSDVHNLIVKLDKTNSNIEKILAEHNIQQNKLLKTNRELEKLAHYDSMVNALNRRGFFSSISSIITLSKRNKKDMAVLMIDIDDFKAVNDSYGHDVGDNVLELLVNTINNTIRNSDIFARFGGEEFVLLLPDTKLDNAKHLAEKIRDLISKIIYKTDKNKTSNFTVSIGIAMMKLENYNIDETLKISDIGLYKAKNSGKNKVCLGKNYTI